MKTVNVTLHVSDDQIGGRRLALSMGLAHAEKYTKGDGYRYIVDVYTGTLPADHPAVVAALAAGGSYPSIDLHPDGGLVDVAFGTSSVRGYMLSVVLPHAVSRAVHDAIGEGGWPSRREHGKAVIQDWVATL